MKKSCALFVLGLAFVASPTLLQTASAGGHAAKAPALLDFSEIQTYNRDDHKRDVTKCDELAAHPSDPEKVTEGIAEKSVDKEKAIEACLTAVQADPDNPRLNYQLARVFGYAGRHAESDPYRLQALKAGYPQSLFVLGYIRLEGWDGRAADPCYGGELIRRSAEVGTYAGLIGFPHYASTGRFDGCESYPVIDQKEINEFLTQAEEGADGYYQEILVKQVKAAFASN